MISITDCMRVEYRMENEIVGFMDIVPHDDYDYCKYIEIYSEYRGKGYATALVDEFIEFRKRDLEFSLTSSYSLGAKFWTRYTQDKKVEHIKGLTFKIEY